MSLVIGVRERSAWVASREPSGLLLPIATFYGDVAEEGLARAALFVSALEPDIVSCPTCDCRGRIGSIVRGADEYTMDTFHEWPCPTCDGAGVRLTSGPNENAPAVEPGRGCPRTGA